MRSAIIFVVLASAFALQPAYGSGSRCGIIVIGTDSSPADADALNLAVAGPHDASHVRICLLGRFRLDSDEYVSFDPAHVDAPDEAVERLEFVGLHGATITGGFQPLRMPPESELPRLAIRDLRFVEPHATAVSIFRGNERIEISGLHVEGVTTEYVPELDAYLHEGIALTTPYAEIDGKVVIERNTLDGGTYGNVEDLQTISAGIALYGAFESLNPYPMTAAISVSRNVLKNWSGSAIAALDVDGAILWRNSIVSGAFGNLNNNGACSSAVGIGSAAGISLAGVTNTLVMGNSVRLQTATDGNGDTPCTVGIILVSDIADVLNIPDSTGNLVTNNTIVGHGTYALLVGRQTPLDGAVEDNFYLANHLSFFAPTGASLIIGPNANGNTFLGHFPTIDGNVAGNTIIDFGF